MIASNLEVKAKPMKNPARARFRPSSFEGETLSRNGSEIAMNAADIPSSKARVVLMKYIDEKENENANANASCFS